MSLYYNTITPQLKSVLNDLMQCDLFLPFRLVGGTSLSLRLGHRTSVDIDLFTNATYRSLDFKIYEDFLRRKYPYFYSPDKTNIIGFGKSYYIGNSEEDNIKLDLYYHNELSEEIEIMDGIRMATIDDVVAMKVDVVSRLGRKKDFWDLHELLHKFSLEDMLKIHEQRFEFTHNRKEIIHNFTDFSLADEDFGPICLKGKIWELIKLDFAEIVDEITTDKKN